MVDGNSEVVGEGSVLVGRGSVGVSRSLVVVGRSSVEVIWELVLAVEHNITLYNKLYYYDHT